MKPSILFVVLLTCAFAVKVSAQQQVKPQVAVRPSSEQSLQELVAEVRQLRAALQRMNAAVYKGQVLLERLKFQQEQVNRNSRELSDVRENIQEFKAVQLRLKEQMRRMEEGVESGVRHPTELAQVKAEFDATLQREQRLMMRETQLATDLEAARVALTDLNDKLNALMEIEIAPK
jgi:chromosome segregation ATPase